MVDYFRDLHSVSRGGLLLTAISLFIFALAFRSVNIGELMSVGGRTSQSAKWQSKVFKLMVGCIAAGVLLFILGFSLPSWEKSGSIIPEKAWYEKWSINFPNDPDLATPLSSAETVRFYQYDNNGEKIFEALIKDEDERQIGSFQRLKSDIGNDDFRVIKGQCQISGGKTIKVELALHGNRECFSGIIYESKSAKRYTCWGKKL